MYGAHVREYVLQVTRMKNKSYKITITAVMTAMTVALMYLSSIMPTGRLGFLGLSSLMGIAAVIESGLSGGIMVYIGGCLLEIEEPLQALSDLVNSAKI